MVKRYINYLKYVVRHKIFVYKCCDLMGLSMIDCLTHDISKLRPSELIPYARTFYDRNGKSQYKPDDAFEVAWLKHIHRNPHHWQHWILRFDNGNTKPLEIPERYVREMVADWAGAGKAITGEWEFKEWYNNNKHKMDIHLSTQKMIIYFIDMLEHRLSENNKTL